MSYHTFEEMERELKVESVEAALYKLQHGPNNGREPYNNIDVLAHDRRRLRVQKELDELTQLRARVALSEAVCRAAEEVAPGEVYGQDDAAAWTVLDTTLAAWRKRSGEELDPLLAQCRDALEHAAKYINADEEAAGLGLSATATKVNAALGELRALAAKAALESVGGKEGA